MTRRDWSPSALWPSRWIDASVTGALIEKLGRRAAWDRAASRLWQRLWRAFVGVSVGTKIMGIVLGVVVLFSSAVTAHVRASMARTLRHELENRGISIARDLAARSGDLVLTHNIFALHQLIGDTAENNRDIQYAFILDAKGESLVHSFRVGVPADLMSANPVAPSQRSRVQILASSEGLIHDVAVPILAGQAGTARVGLSEHRLYAQMAVTTRQLLLITLVVSLAGVLGGLLLTVAVTRPVKALVEFSGSVAQGDLTARAPRFTDDEIGLLAGSFNAMVDELSQALEHAETSNSQLLQRHRELAATAAVAQAVSSRRLDLPGTLEQALSVALDVTGMEVGWIMLLSEDGQRSSVGGYLGLPRDIIRKESAFRFPLCECAEAIDSRRPVVLPLAYDGCPVRSVKLGDGNSPVCHATVPLLTRSRVLGVMNILSDDPARFDASELTLLGAIGRQLGVAIENARLLDELKQRDALRGHLLRAVISAEEETRRRIARELHDEIGQSMASMVLGLKAAGAALSIDPPRSEEILDGLRASVSGTVKELHNIVYDLRPTLLDDLGLIPALRWYAESRLEANGIECALHVEGEPKRLPSEVETALFRIAQEAITNVIRHSGAEMVWLRLSFGEEQAAVEVRDNGHGFEPTDVWGAQAEGRQFGLLGIHERTSLLGGTFEVHSALGEGAVLCVHVPLSMVVGEDGDYTHSVGG